MSHAPVIVRAANQNDLDLLKRALRGELGAVSEDEMEEALIRAANNGNLACLSALLDYGVSPDTADNDNDTPLMLAACNNKVRVMTALLRGGASVNLTSDYGRTALHMACWNGHGHLASMLLDAGINHKIKDMYGDTALMLAALNGHCDVVRVLLACHCDVNTVNHDRDSALHYAAKRNHADVVRLLTQSGAERNGKNSWGLSPLMLACERNSVDALQSLLSSKVNVNLTGPCEKTALHMAAKHGHTRCVILLLTHDAHPDYVDSEGHTPAMYAYSNFHIDIVRMLIRAGADIDSFCHADTSICYHDLYLTNNLEMAKVLYAASCQQNIAQSLMRDPRYNKPNFQDSFSEVWEWLQQLAREPESLETIVRREIRGILRGKMHLSYTLPIPLTLKTYLNMYDNVYNPKL